MKFRLELDPMWGTYRFEGEIEMADMLDVGIPIQRVPRSDKASDVMSYMAAVYREIEDRKEKRNRRIHPMRHYTGPTVSRGPEKSPNSRIWWEGLV